MQSILPQNIQSQNNFPDFPILKSPIFEVSAALFFNALSLFHQCYQAKKIHYNIHPLIPIMTLSLTVTLTTLIALKILNKENKTFESYAKRLSRFSIINTLALSYLTFFIHELGHAATSALCFKNANPKIAITPFQGGSTIYASSYGLTSYGLKLGEEKVFLLVTAAGMAASYTACFFLTKISNRIKLTHVFFSTILKDIALTQILAEALLAIKSLIEKDENYHNDYTLLLLYGNVHPLITLITLSVTSLSILF